MSGRGEVVEVVDAVVLLHHPDVELLRDAVELGREPGVHRLAAVERDHRLLEDLRVGEAQEEVLRERGQGHVAAVLVAAGVDADRAAAPSR